MAVTIVQSNSNSGAGTSATVTLTNPSAGNAILVFVSMQVANKVVNSCSDDNDGSYGSSVCYGTKTATRGWAYLLKNGSGKAGTLTITAALSGSVDWHIAACEVSGHDTGMAPTQNDGTYTNGEADTDSSLDGESRCPCTGAALTATFNGRSIWYWVNTGAFTFYDMAAPYTGNDWFSVHGNAMGSTCAASNSTTYTPLFRAAGAEVGIMLHVLMPEPSAALPPKRLTLLGTG